MKEEPKMLSIAEAAEQLSVTRNTIKNMAARGQIQLIRKPFGHQRLFVPADEVKRLLKEAEAAPTLDVGLGDAGLTQRPPKPAKHKGK